MKKRVFALLAVLPFFLVFFCLGERKTRAMPAGWPAQAPVGGTYSRSNENTLAPETAPSRWEIETMDASSNKVG
jgi:hypothetical protein